MPLLNEDWLCKKSRVVDDFLPLVQLLMPLSLFDPVVPEQRLHPNVVRLREEPGAEPTRLMMEYVFASLAGLTDGNFVEQFQTTGFDARVFELFLHAYFTSIDAHIGRAHERPDYIVTRNGLTIAVEATTANPTQVPGVPPAVVTGVDLQALVDEDEQQRRERTENEIPIRVGSALFSKLGKEYWKLPHVSNRPLVFAIEPFHAHDSLLFSSAPISQYLYGIRQTGSHDADGRLVIDTQPVATHQQGAKVIPSGFFMLPGAEYVSAVLFTNAGSVGKFTRMGYQAGFHRGNVTVVRFGEAWDPDPDAAKAESFMYRMDEDPRDEPWGSGIEVFHNPHALLPIPDDFFADAIQTRLEDGAPVSLLPRFAPFFSVTQRMHWDFESLAPVEERSGGVGTILRTEFDAYDPVRPPYEAGIVPFSEVAWFADEPRRVLGTITRWHGQEDYGLIVLGPDEQGKWRAIDMDSEYPSLDAAALELIRRMKEVSASGQIFERGMRSQRIARPTISFSSRAPHTESQRSWRNAGSRSMRNRTGGCGS